MIEPRVRVDLRDIDRGLEQVIRRADNLRPVFVALKAPLRADQKAHHAAREGSEGGWPPLAASTLRKRKSRRRRGGTAARAILGRLRTALTLTTARDRVTVTSKAAYGIAHQEGAQVGKGGRTRLPQREFLWLSEAFIERAVREIREYVWRLW